MKKISILFIISFWTSVALAQEFITTWATAEQLVEPHNLPPKPGLSGNTLRQIVQVSVGGEQLRLRLSNEHSTEPTEIKSIEIANAKSAGSSMEIDEKSTKRLKFNKKKGVVIPANGTATSDVIDFHLATRQNVAITIHYGNCSNKVVTGHPGSRTTSYLVEGQKIKANQEVVQTNHWYNILAIDVVKTPELKGINAVAVLGNSITDGRGTTTNGQDRWTDNLSRRGGFPVLNFGLGGNCVLHGGLGPTGKSRYQRDLFGQEGVKYIILFEGVNDLGGSRDAVQTAKNIIEVYKQIIKEAHEKGMLVFGGTITPIKGNGYYSEDHENGRQYLNNWIRESKDFDGLIDFDKAVCDPSDQQRLNPEYLYENDWLHPNAKGYLKMGECVDLGLFSR